MKRAFTALALLLLLSIPGWSKSTNCADSAATPIDTLHADLMLAGSGSTQTAFEIIVARTSSGQIIYRILPETISFSGTCDSLNGMLTSKIFDLLAQASVSQGIALGYTACSTSCSPPTTVTVVIPACVARTGSGASTHFSTCANSGCCTRYYGVCCPSGPGSPVVTLISSSSTGCSGTGACESTCP